MYTKSVQSHEFEQTLLIILGKILSQREHSNAKQDHKQNLALSFSVTPKV